MVGRFTRPVCSRPRLVCHYSVPCLWSRKVTAFLSVDGVPGSIRRSQPEILERDSKLLTERAGDYARESLALSARRKIHELCVSPPLPAAKIDDAPNAWNANGVFRKTVVLRPLDDLSQCRRLGELGDHGLRGDSNFRSRNF